MKVGGGASSEPLGTSTAREGGGMASGALNEPLCSPTVREGMEAAVLVALELSWRPSRRPHRIRGRYVLSVVQSGGSLGSSMAREHVGVVGG